jgi:hypothetical protein
MCGLWLYRMVRGGGCLTGFKEISRPASEPSGTETNLYKEFTHE